MKEKNVVLEVEKPIDKITKKRIKFYENHGFKLHLFDYIMSKIRSNTKPIPMYLMTNGKLEKQEFEKLKGRNPSPSLSNKTSN
jgi:hypothetical protein